ncbi:MAG: hypothetical protein M9962_00175 [Oligoflexia bacterium]|nr:hypothetical protein [Oligoflexia bacterium]
MIRITFLVFLITCITQSSTAHAEPSGFFLTYGQSQNAWGIISDIKNAKNNISNINQILNKNYGSYETLFAKIGTRHTYLTKSPSWPQHYFFELGGESAGLGLVQNPVVPEFTASIIAMGVLTVGVDGRAFNDDLRILASLSFGAGIERRVSATSTDLINKIPFQKDTVLLVGGDLRIQKLWRFSNTRWVLSGEVEDTYFRASEAVESVALDRKVRSNFLRYQGRLDFLYSFLNLHAIGGPHPLPSKFLPRVWHRVSNTRTNREIGAMSGAGAGFSWKAGPTARMAITAGYYAGYVGGEFRTRWNQGTEFRIGTYQLENSSAYKTLGQRVYWLATHFSY